MEIRFHITKEKFETLTWDDWAAIESAGEGNFKPRELKELAARFLVDEQQAYLDPAEAKKILGKLTTEQMVAALRQLSEAITAYAVPKEKDASSS